LTNKSKRNKKNMKSTRIKLLAVGAVATLVTVIAQANTITGSIWENFPTITGNENGSLANAALMMANGPAAVTFSVTDPINFNSNNDPINGYTVGGFLATGGATILTGASHSSDNLDNTLFYFTGSVTLVQNQTYVVAHDDGLQLMVGNVLLVDVPGPTAAVNTDYTWAGASGTYSFELAYAEVDGPPAVLSLDLPLQSVPDSGSTVALLGGALTLMGTLASRFRK
jgi:hypothetical protein